MSIEITTSYSDLPDDVKSALAQINALTNVGLACLKEPSEFESGIALADKLITESYEIIQQLLCDRE